MAEFLTTTGVSYRLEEIIKNATKRLVIISPYLKVNQRIKDLLEDKNRMKIDVRVVYGKNELQPEENNWLGSMRSIRTSFCENLHAKCYLSETEALLTSMNLYEFSEINNNEMGILVSREKDQELYDKIDEEADRIIRISEDIRVEVKRIEATDAVVDVVAQRRPTLAQTAKVTPSTGFCIRCKTDLPASPTQPYCWRCYASWNRYENKTYEEKHCHTCGKAHAATLAKPACLTCYKKYKDVLEFAAG